MLRSQAIKLAQANTRVRAAKFATRRYATQPPPPAGQPAPNPKAANQKDNTLVYVGLGLATGAGIYYYVRNSDEAADLEKRARRDEERVRVNAQQAFDATKDRADVLLQQGQRKVDHAEDAAREKYDSAKSRAQGAVKEAQAEGRGLLDRAEEKLEYANKAVKDNFNQTRNSTEALYREARDNAEHKSAELRADADRKAREAKQGWFSWLGFGKSKVEEGENAAREAKDKLDTEAERLRKEAARGVANAAEDVRVKAEKRT
ncbi:hypothetical protein H1R20_g5836, partial [Candolleomyces eurysporus]